MQSNKQVGRFMVAVGAIIRNKLTGKILLIKRSPYLDWQPGMWEIVYGRMNQFETPQTALKRELKEEVGIEVGIGEPLTIWHIFRGKKRLAENELVGITYCCETEDNNIKLSPEHCQYQWVSAEKALKMIQIKSIKKDILAYTSTNRSEP